MTAPPGREGGPDEQPLRVLVVTVVHDPEDARIRHRQLLSLLAAGCLVTYSAPFAAYDRTPPAGVRAVDLPRARGRRRLRALVAAVRMLHREARWHDVVLVHDPELLLAVALSGTTRCTTAVWDVHEDTAAALSMKTWLPAPARRALPALVRAGERLAERHVRLTLAESGYVVRFRAEHPVVPNSVLVPPGPLPEPGRDRVVYLGRVTRPRGALELVALGRELAGEVVVEVVGPADADVEAQVRAAHELGHILWRGFVPNDEALASLPGALAGLSLLHDEPNYAHSRPTKIMEYMAHGVPVITTPTAAAAELVDRSGAGAVVPYGDVPAAARAVRALLVAADERARLGHAGRSVAERELDWRRDGVRLVGLLTEWATRDRP